MSSKGIEFLPLPLEKDGVGGLAREKDNNPLGDKGGCHPVEHQADSTWPTRGGILGVHALPSEASVWRQPLTLPGSPPGWLCDLEQTLV